MIYVDFIATDDFNLEDLLHKLMRAGLISSDRRTNVGWRETVQGAVYAYIPNSHRHTTGKNARGNQQQQNENRAHLELKKTQPQQLRKFFEFRCIA